MNIEQDPDREPTWSEIDSLRAELEKVKSERDDLRKTARNNEQDKKRLDWLSEHTFPDRFGVAQEICYAVQLFGPISLREAIDAAIQHEENQSQK